MKKQILHTLTLSILLTSVSQVWAQDFVVDNDFVLEIGASSSSTGISTDRSVAAASNPTPPETERSETAASDDSQPASDFLSNALAVVGIKEQKNFEISSKKASTDKDHVLINSCSDTARYRTIFSERFHWYSDARRKKVNQNNECDQSGLAMNQSLAGFMEKNFHACVREGALAAGVNIDGVGGSRVVHDGCIAGSAHRGQSPRSWHNDGVALDINAIEVGGHMFRYKDALGKKTYDYDVTYKTAYRRNKKGKRIKYQKKIAKKTLVSSGEGKQETVKFFDAFRTCWGRKVDQAPYKQCQERTSSCKINGGQKTCPSGTIGNEDHRHHNHLHISLPCKDPKVADEFGGRASLDTFMDLFDVSSVNLPEVSSPQISAALGIGTSQVVTVVRGLASMADREPATKKSVAKKPVAKAAPEEEEDIQVHSVNLDSKREIHAFVERRDEPVGSPIMIIVKQVCKDTPDKNKFLSEELFGCAFESLTASGEGNVRLVYRVMEMKGGVLKCTETRTEDFNQICK